MKTKVMEKEQRPLSLITSATTWNGTQGSIANETAERAWMNSDLETGDVRGPGWGLAVQGTKPCLLFTPGPQGLDNLCSPLM